MTTSDDWDGGSSISESRLSEHIPDLDLITYYGENNRSISSKISPWTKLAALIAIVLFITIVQDAMALTALYAAVMAVYYGSGLPVKRLVQWYLLPVAFVFSLVILLMWTEPGETLLSISAFGIIVRLTDNGLLLVVRLLLKALISMTFSIYFLMTTRYAYLSAMIYRIFPSPIDQIFLMAYRFIFITLRMANSMMKALASRGGGLIKSMVRQSQMFAEVYALVVIRSYDRAERVQKAMESRGYSGRYIAATKIPKAGYMDYLIIFVMLFAFQAFFHFG